MHGSKNKEKKIHTNNFQKKYIQVKIPVMFNAEVSRGHHTSCGSWKFHFQAAKDSQKKKKSLTEKLITC